MRALLLVVLVALIGAGALYILSGGDRDALEVSSVASTLKEMTSRVGFPSKETGTTEANWGNGDADLGRWFGGDDPEEAPSNKEVYYQYVDDSGTVHFVQNLGEVPAKWQSRAGRIEVEKTAPAPRRGGPEPADTGRAGAKSPGRKVAAYRADPEVVVYTTTWCGWCRKTLAFLDERGVRYVNKDIEANDWNREELIKKTGRTSIPVVEINGEIIRGFNAQRMEQLLSGSG